MSSGSSSAYLLWAILSCIFLVFLVLHLWLYDRFNCLKWDSGRQPGAFKRVMTYSYLGTLPLLVCFSVAMTVIKYNEGFAVLPDGRIIPRPFMLWSPMSKRWFLPLLFVLSFSWALEIVTHLEELTFWLFLLHQGPGKRDWFHSWEFRTWYLGSIVAILGMPLTILITRHHLETSLAWLFLVGSLAGTSTTLYFLYVLFRFPAFLEYVKAEGADPDVVVRLATFYQLNWIRVFFRFLFTTPLLLIAADAIQGPFPIISNPFALDFLLMMAGIGSFISSAITLLIFFPRSITHESGYRAKIITPPVSAKVPTVTSATPQYYHDHYLHERGASNPISALEHANSPASTVRMNAFRFPHQDEHYHINELDSSAQAARAPRRRDSAESADLSLGYSSDAESFVMTPPTVSPHLPIHQSVSQPGHRRLSNPSGGAKSDDTVWDGLARTQQQEDTSASALRRHSDGPFVYSRHGKDLRVAPGALPSQERLRDRPQSQLHPYLINFTSPIDLMDGRDAERASAV